MENNIESIDLGPLMELYNIFNGEWEISYLYTFNPDNQEKTKTLGQFAPRKCRFCGKSSPEVTFTSEAHVIACAFGNRLLLHHEECDFCNNIGSKFETALSTMLTVSRAT